MLEQFGANTNMKKEKKTTKKELKRLAKLERKKKLKAWANAVLERDHECCVICGARKGDLYVNKKGKTLKRVIHAHHIIPKEVNEFVYDVMNGISLCSTHHKYCKEISAHKNSLAFIVWLESYRPEQYNYLKDKIKSKFI